MVIVPALPAAVPVLLLVMAVSWATTVSAASRMLPALRVPVVSA
jgi:hypothetical protein